MKADGGRPAGWLKAERYIEKEVDMVSFNKVTRVIAGIAATALLIPMAACGGGSSSGGSAAPADIPAVGTDDGTEITLWTRSPLERQAKNAVKAYNASHKNQVKLEIIPNDDMEGKVGGASQTDSLPDILAGDVVRIPYWASEGIFTDITKQIDGLDNKSDLQQGHIELAGGGVDLDHDVIVLDLVVLLDSDHDGCLDLLDQVLRGDAALVLQHGESFKKFIISSCHFSGSS